LRVRQCRRAVATGNSRESDGLVGSSRFVLTVFVILQVADGLITFGAVRLFGPAAEGNFVLQTWIQLLGPGATLLAAKTMACAGAALLYFTGRNRTLIALTTLLASVGVGPWLVLLRGLS
jgi:Na+/melibiose symporter-like transporter